MHVIHLYDGHEPVGEGHGSVPTVVWNIARETVAKGNDVTILERQWAGLPATEREDGVRFERLKLSTGTDEPWTRVPYELVNEPSELARLVVDRTNFALRALFRLRSKSFDILHIHLPFAANVLLTVAPRFRDRTVYTAHIGEESERLQLGSGENQFGVLRLFSPDLYLMKRSKRTVVLNRRLQAMLEHKGLRNLETVPNGVDVDAFPAEEGEVERVRSAYDLNGFVIMFAGSITPRKGVDVLIDAAERVVDQVDAHVQFVLVGTTALKPEYVAALRRRVHQNDLEGYVRFTGYVPYKDIKALYGASDVFVLPSMEDGFGMVLTEAMASHTALIGSDIGGISMQIVEGENGYLIEQGDDEQLAQQLLYLVEHEGETRRMGERSRSLAEAEFSWERITDRYLDVYEKVSE